MKDAREFYSVSFAKEEDEHRQGPVLPRSHSISRYFSLS